MHSLQDAVPPLLIQFLLTVSFSFLAGLALKEYYIASGKSQTFGSARTYVFIGALGFVLYRLNDERLLYLGGLLTLTVFLALYYRDKIAHERFGMIGILTALLTYAIGPVSLECPPWFLVLYVITVLLVLNSKAKIQVLAETIADREIITLAKFLLLIGVILPLVPNTPVSPLLPVTPYQTWLAVVVVTAISYVGYLVQTYLFPNRGLLLTGLIGGVYSSTATTVVLAKKAREGVAPDAVVAAGIVLATSVMYLRLLAVVAIFQLELCLRLLAPFLVFAAVGVSLGALVYRSGTKSGRSVDVAPPRNPLELGPAVLFAGLFVFMALATRLVLERYRIEGLQWMSFVVGVTDIDPFVLSLLQGKFDATAAQIAQAIIIASASNNLLKAAYSVAFGDRRSGRLAAPALLALTVVPLAYALIWI